MTNTKKSSRIKYNFQLNFPETFTMSDLRKAKCHKVKYITLYARVRKALDNGVLVEAGLKNPDKARRGRKEVVYKRVDAQPAVATADVAVPTAVNW